MKVIVLFALFLIVLPALAQERNINTYNFSSNATFDEKKRIYWLDASEDFANWKFENLPEKAFKNTVKIHFELILTDDKDSPGKEGMINVSYSNPMTGQKFMNSVFMRNTAGYNAVGTTEISVTLIKGGKLNVVINPYQISELRLGVQSISVWIVEPEWIYERETAAEFVFVPTAYTALRGGRPTGERYHRIGVNVFINYMPRAEIEALKDESVGFLGLTLKWKLLEEYNYIPATSVGFTGVYPFLRRPRYMKGEVFGIAFAALSKSFIERLTLTTGFAKGTIIDMLTYIPVNEQKPLESKARNMIFFGVRVKINSWLSLLVEGFQSPSDKTYLATPAVCVSTLDEHLGFNLGMSYSNINSNRKIENYLLVRGKW